MTLLDIGLLVFTTLLIFGIIIYYLISKNKENNNVNHDGNSPQLQLQAYERLILLVNRIALPNLISRVNVPGIGAKEMQLMLTQDIRREFEYNITQQIYVSADAWTAVKNLKEQNMLIINQLGNLLPANANGLDLNKRLLEFLMNDKKGALHEVVSEVLSYEAKKILTP